MRQLDIAYMWIFIAINAVLLVWVSYLWIRKTRLLKWEKATGRNKGNQASLKKYDKQYNLGVRIILTVSTLLFSLSMIPSHKDIPALVNGNYIDTTGIVTKDQNAPGNEKILTRYTVFVKDINTNEIIRVRISDYGLRNGDQVHIRYLPNSKNGSLIGYSRADSDIWHDLLEKK